MEIADQVVSTCSSVIFCGAPDQTARRPDSGSFIMPGVNSAIAHVGDWPPIGCGVIWFVAYFIGNQDQ
jgi:hypothetical protein